MSHARWRSAGPERCSAGLRECVNVCVACVSVLTPADAACIETG